MALTTEHAARQMQGPLGSCGRKTIHSGDRPIVLLTCALQDGSSGVASVRFPVQHWTPEEAKGWLKDHGFRANTFVVAKGYGMPKSRKTMGYAGKRMRKNPDAPTWWTSAHDQAYTALQAAGERIGAAMVVQRTKGGKFKQPPISEPHQEIIDALNALTRNKISPDEAMAVLHGYDVFQARMKAPRLKPSVRRNHSDLSEMVQGYLEAALWTSTDESTPAGGEPLDKNYSPGDIDEQSQVKMARDCEKFYDANEADCHEYMDVVGGGRDYTAMEKLGHDFWLTRNGHGTGFWDRDVGPVGDRLSKAAEEFGESNLYVGDDGAIYVS